MRLHFSLVRPFALVAASVVLIVVGLRLMLRIPGIPYNVAELFWDNGSLSALMFFAFALLWIGGGAKFVAHMLASSRRPYLMLPVLLVFVSLVSRMLVSRAATYESLGDIFGTINLFDLVTTQGIWGEWWRELFVVVGVSVINFLEQRTRYCALYSIPLLCCATAFLAARWRSSGLWRHRTADIALFMLVAVAWIWLCGSIVLTWASTDNLTELVASSGPLGIPAPLFLLGVMLLLGCNAAVLLNASRAAGKVLATAVSMVAVPASWWLLNAGLESRVEKYGLIFPATRFLLGHDRQTEITDGALFLRWVFVYLVFLACVVVGGWLYEEIAAALIIIFRRRSTPGTAS